jgi:CheY-like chemotaxis protein
MEPLKISAEQPDSQHPLRILVVEDDPESLQMMGALLGLWGYEPRLVPAGPAALEAVEEEMPDIVLLDLGLPGMDGFEVARRLRGRPGGDDIFIAAVTAYRGEEHQRQAREAGFDRYLMKPVDIDTLRQLLSQTANGERPPQPDYDD